MQKWKRQKDTMIFHPTTKKNEWKKEVDKTLQTKSLQIFMGK